MNLSIVFKVFQITIINILIVVVILTFFLQKNHTKLQEAEIIRFKSYVIADELKQSSDDLTRYSRTYVLTSDSIWEKRYWEVLDIRNGKLPRPDGRTIALQDSMKKLGFTEAEFDKLRIAEKNSNELVWTEKVAFNAMKGYFHDGNGEFTIKGEPDVAMAQRIMFDEKYHDDKKSIMDPISVFFTMLNKRTHDAVANYEAVSSNLLTAIISLIILMLVIGIVSFFIILDKIIKKLKDLETSNKLITSKNAELSRFTYITSHDLQEPLNTIISFSSLLKDGYYEKLEGIGKKSIEVIDSSTLRMKNLIISLLGYTKIGGQATLQTVNVNELVDEIKVDLTDLIDQNKAKVAYDDLSKITAFKNELRMLFTNLIVNAIKYGKAHIPPQINIKCEENRNEYTYTVSDNGIGIDMRFKDKIFDVFQRLHTNDQYSGTGIGLANCKKVVELHKGSIWVNSKVGEGSEFSFTIKKEI